MSFDSFALDSRLLAAVRAMGFTKPTPIQEQAIPVCLQGKDVMGLAQTGTGKTAAFGLPMLHRLAAKPGKGKPRALVLAPTRELADQIHESLRTLAGQMRTKTACIYGGVGMEPQVRAVRAGAEIVVACPGRLLDHMNERTIDLSHVEILVLDEADRMLDMGFIADIRKITRTLPKQRQTMLFSATMPSDVAELARELLHHPVRVEVANTRVVETVAHALYPVPQHLKTKLLEEILKHTDTESVLIFVRTKHRAERLAKHLRTSGIPCASLQGNLSQNRRKAALDGFRDGRTKILVATDIAARGIDISTISHVINFDMPDTVEAYTHRIGRTGRAAKTGDAYTLVTEEDRDLVRDLEKKMKQQIERRMIDGFNYKYSKVETKREEKKVLAAAGGHEYRESAHKGPGRPPGRGGGRFNDRRRRDDDRRGKGSGGHGAGKSHGHGHSAAKGAGHERAAGAERPAEAARPSGFMANAVGARRTRRRI